MPRALGPDQFNNCPSKRYPQHARFEGQGRSVGARHYCGRAHHRWIPKSSATWCSFAQPRKLPPRVRFHVHYPMTISKATCRFFTRITDQMRKRLQSYKETIEASPPDILFSRYLIICCSKSNESSPRLISKFNIRHKVSSLSWALQCN